MNADKMEVRFELRLSSSQVLDTATIERSTDGTWKFPNAELDELKKRYIEGAHAQVHPVSRVYDCTMDEHTRVELWMLGHPAWPGGLMVETIFEFDRED